MKSDTVKLIQEGKMLYRLIHVVGHFGMKDVMRYLEITKMLTEQGYKINFKKDTVIFKKVKSV